MVAADAAHRISGKGHRTNLKLAQSLVHSISYHSWSNATETHFKLPRFNAKKISVVFMLQLFDLTKLIGRPTLNGVVLLGRNRWRRRRRRSRRRSRGVMTLVWRTFDGARFAFVDGTLWRRCLVFFKWTKPGLFLLILVTFNNNFYRKMIVVVEGKYADHQMQGAYVPPFACLQRLQSNLPMLGYFWQRMK